MVWRVGHVFFLFLLSLLECWHYNVVVHYALSILHRSYSSDADPLLLTRANLIPTLTDYSELDLTSWTSKSMVHTVAAKQVVQ